MLSSIDWKSFIFGAIFVMFILPFFTGRLMSRKAKPAY